MCIYKTNKEKSLLQKATGHKIILLIEILFGGNFQTKHIFNLITFILLKNLRTITKT